MTNTWPLILLTIANLLILIANAIMFGLNLKLYTEWFKDRAIQRRKDKE